MELATSKVDGTSGANIDLSEQVFDQSFNEDMVHQVVVAYMAAGRAGTVAQKTRSEVRGGGAKPWRQKGTGRARSGTIRSPIWRAGGRTFAAKPRDYSQKVNKKMYRGAMRAILSELLRQERLRILENLEVSEPKTKQIAQLISNLELTGKILILIKEADVNVFLAARNLPKVEIEVASWVDPVSLVEFDTVVATSEAIKDLEERLK